MARFRFRAVDGVGAAKRGTLDAETAEAARRALRAKALLPMSVEQISGAGPGRRVRLAPKTLALITRQLATLTSGGVRIEDALLTVAEGAAPKPAVILTALRAAVLDGQSFGRALDSHPSVFGEAYRASVRAGEGAGQLPTVLDHLADYVETRAKNAQTVQLALLYPALLALLSLGVIVALLTFVVPDIVRVFTNRGAELPMLTRALIATSDALSRYGLTALLVVTAIGVGVGALLQRPEAKAAWHRMQLRMPGLRTITLKHNASQFTGTLATLATSRVPLTEALAAAADTIPNRAFRQEVRTAATRVEEGTALSVALGATKLFPPLLMAMIASGEQSGAMGQSLARAAETQARDLDALVSAIVALVEPGVLLVMGGVVMVLVMAILLPIVSMNGLTG